MLYIVHPGNRHAVPGQLRGTHPQLLNYKCNAMKYIWRKYKVQYITCSITQQAGGGQVNLIRSVDQNLTLVLSWSALVARQVVSQDIQGDLRRNACTAFKNHHDHQTFSNTILTLKPLHILRQRVQKNIKCSAVLTLWILAKSPQKPLCIWQCFVWVHPLGVWSSTPWGWLDCWPSFELPWQTCGHFYTQARRLLSSP